MKPEQANIFAPLKITAVIIVFFCLLQAIVCLAEFYSIAIAGNTKGYPWGPVNENPWYYRTPGTYAAYCFGAGMVLLLCVAITIKGLLKHRYGMVAVAVCAGLFLSLLQMAGS